MAGLFSFSTYGLVQSDGDDFIKSIMDAEAPLFLNKHLRHLAYVYILMLSH